MAKYSCHHKFTIGIDEFLKREALETVAIYDEMKKRFPECISEKHCDHGYNRSELAGYEWQHMVRRAQQSLQRRNVIKRMGTKWYHLGIEENLSHVEEEEIESEYRNEDLEKIRNELLKITAKSPVYEYIRGRRFKRDNATVAKLKILRGFKCQMCKYTIKKRNGNYYIEGAHISEKKKGGPELPSNILILCPNHHKEFDYGNRVVLKHTNGSVQFNLNGKMYDIDLRI